MNTALRITAPAALAALTLVPGLAHAAGPARGGSSHQAAATAPRPVIVLVGGQRVASGQILSGAIARVQGQVPFAIRAPRYAPAGYVPVQLAVTPRLRGVSGGFTTLSYALSTRGGNPLTSAAGFQINQASTPLVFDAGTRVITVTVGQAPTSVREFKAAGHDLLILTGLDSSGSSYYDITTDAVASHLSPVTLARIAASLR